MGYRTIVLKNKSWIKGVFIMKNFNDERLRDLIAEGTSDILEIGQNLEDYEPGYNAYLAFSILGSLIVRNEGLDRLNKYVDEIKSKSSE